MRTLWLFLLVALSPSVASAQVPMTFAGAERHSKISVGTTEDEAEIKATQGVLFSIAATNTNAAVRYLKCYNGTAANTAPGTTTPWLRLAVPGLTTGGHIEVSFPIGVLFSNALTCALVTGSADSDVAEVAAGELLWFITYK